MLVWRRRLTYIPVLAAGMALMMLRPLIMAKLLNVQGFAEYSTGLLVSASFCMLGGLGLQSLLQRDMPRYLLKGQRRKATILQLQSILVPLVYGAIALLFGFAFPSILGVRFGHSILIISLVHGLSQQIFLLATVESRSNGEPLRFAYQTLFRAFLIVLFASITGLLVRSPVAVLAVEAAVSVVVSLKILKSCFLSARLEFRVLLALAVRRLPRLPWSNALALLAVGTISFAYINLDRWLAAGMLSVIAFGQYAFAWVILMVAHSSQNIVNASVFPVLARRLAKHGSRNCYRIATNVSAVLLLVGGILIFPVAWGLKLVIMHWFPNYLPATSLIALFLGTGVLRLSDFWSSYLIITGYEKRLLFIKLAVVAAVLLIWFFAVFRANQNNAGLTAFALLAFALSLANYLTVFITSFSKGHVE